MGFKLKTRTPAPKVSEPKSNAVSDLLKKEIFIFGVSFSNKSKQFFYKDLAILLKAGVSLREALVLISGSQKKKRDKDLIEKILIEVLAGKAFFEVIRDSGHFSEYEFRSIEIGEETGTLSKICDELGVYYERKNEQRRIVISAATYPLLVIMTAAAVVVFMLSYIVPMFQDIFRQNGLELPLLTRVVVSLSNALSEYGLYLLVLMMVAVMLGRVFKDDVRARNFLHHLVLKIPGVRQFVLKVYLAQFAQATSLLTSSKVPLLNSIRLVRNMIHFVPLQEALTQVEAGIMRGSSLTASMKECNIFDDRIISLVKVAEETNQTEFVFAQLSAQYNQEVLQQSKVMSTLLEPLIILIVGIIVAILLIAMYLPMFQLSSVIG